VNAFKVLIIEGRLMKRRKCRSTLGNNCVSLIWRYEFNGTEIDHNRIDVGMTMKGSYEGLCIVFRWLCTLYGECQISASDVWSDREKIITRDGYFNFYVPLGMLLGFCENYKYVVINARHELIFDTSAQWQLHCGRSSDRTETWIVQDTIECLTLR